MTFDPETLQQFLPRKCDVCGQPATIHDTEIVNGEPVARHLCRAHGEAVVLATMPRITPDMQADFAAAVAAMKKAVGE